jgi:hypothetical protein
MIFHVTLDRSDAEWVVVECPALPGVASRKAATRKKPSKI